MNNFKNITLASFFLVLISIGFSNYRDYGISIDEPSQRGIGQQSLIYLDAVYQKHFNLKKLEATTAPSVLPASVFTGFKDRDYGVIFELPVEFFIHLFNVQESSAYYFRHLSLHLLFLISVYVFYIIVKNRYGDYRIGFLAALMFVLSPRIYGESFYNDKDIFFLITFIFAIYGFTCFINKPNLFTLIINALTSAIAIDSRLMALIFPCLMTGYFLIYYLRRSISTKKFILYLCIYFPSLILFIVLLWPWLWSDPLSHFLEAVKRMSRFPNIVGMNFMGYRVQSNDLPGYYLPVWIGITTPVLYIIFFIFGFFSTLKNIFVKKWHLIGNKLDEQDIFFLILFIAPLTGIIAIHPVLYNGWRHVYFLYAPLLLVSINGVMYALKICKKKFFFNLLLIVLATSLISSATWMIKWSPYQYLYFNSLAGNWNKNYDVDYWGVAYGPLLKKIVNQDNSATYKIYASVESWHGWQLPWLNHLSLLNPKDSERIMTNYSENCSDYIIAAYHKAHQYSKNSDFMRFDELIVDGSIIYTTFKRRIPLFDEYSPQKNTTIFFSNQNTSCFAADWSPWRFRHESRGGWSDSHENWGVWSKDKKAVLTLLTPPANFDQIILTLRAYVNPKHPVQKVSIGINGQIIKEVKLSNFDKNTVKITIPQSALKNPTMIINFEIPDAISPKVLGLGNDDRLLGIGLISAKFE